MLHSPDNLLDADFFARDALALAPALLGKVIRHRVGDLWLAARIIETEAYCLAEKASHASLGFTHNRRALFMPPGYLYLYYARGGDSLNFSALGDGNAVLVKSAHPVVDALSTLESLALMQRLNPDRQGRLRDLGKLCAGQTLLCKSLGLKVPQWNAKRPDAKRLRLEDCGFAPPQVIQTRRLGIAAGRDAHLPWRFVDAAFAHCCTKNPLRRGQLAGRDYFLLNEN